MVIYATCVLFSFVFNRVLRNLGVHIAVRVLFLKLKSYLLWSKILWFSMDSWIKSKLFILVYNSGLNFPVTLYLMHLLSQYPHWDTPPEHIVPLLHRIWREHGIKSSMERVVGIEMITQDLTLEFCHPKIKQRQSYHKRIWTEYLMK